MIEDRTDDRLDALVRQQRPDSVRTTKAWRHSQRQALLAHIHGVDGAEQDATDQRLISPPRSLHMDAPNRRWGWAAAAVLVTGGIAALASLPGNGPEVATPAGPTQTGTAQSSDSAEDSSTPAPQMIVPGVAVSPEVSRLLLLPTCDTADGLAEWTTDQLRWWRDLDPSTAQAAPFSQVTASVAVDTAATSATCSVAIAIDGAFAWGLGDGNGNWVARATGVPDAEDYDWPESNRDRNGDDGTGGQFGTGQFFNDFNVRTTDLEPIAAGALSPSTKSGPSAIYIVDFADEIPPDAEPSRLWYLRTTAPKLDETVGGPPEPSLTPTLVPEGFGQCTVEYTRQNSTGQFAFAIDYCDTTSTITVTAGTVVDGDNIVVDDVDIAVERNDDRVRVGFATDGPVVIGPPETSVDALAATLASIPAARTSVPSTLPEPASQVAADLAEAGISPADDARNRAIAKTLVDTVVGLGADMAWAPADVVVRLKDNVPFYMTADSPGGTDEASVTIDIRQYQADELADPDFLEEIGFSQPVERYEDGSSLFIQDAPERGFASANLVIADLVISVQSQNLITQDRTPVKASVLAGAARDIAATTQQDLSAN